MQVAIKYFAVVRERLDAEGETLVLDEGASVADLWRVLIDRHPVLDGLRPHLRIAVNLDFVDDTIKLTDGDEIALIPPVAGGVDRARLLETPLDTEAVVARVQRDSDGAVVTFVGVVRNHSQGRRVSYLEYESYGEMAVAKLVQILDELEAKWPGGRGAVDHRTGRLAIGDAAVVIAVAAPHRLEAFEACQYVIDRIKEIVPIWKREVGPDGDEWVGMGS